MEALAREHGLTVRIDGHDDTGWDFHVAHATEPPAAERPPASWILRVPRRPDVADRIPVEAGLLELLRPILPVAVPHWLIRTRDLVAYHPLPGEPLAAEDPITLTHEWHHAPSDRFLADLARVLATLHDVPTATATEIGVPRRGAEALRRETDDELDIARSALDVPEPLVRRWRDWLDDDRYWPADTALVHGDLHPGHTLVDPAGELSGVLDWADAAVTDPAVDLAAPRFAFGSGGLDRLLDHLAREPGAGETVLAGRTLAELTRHVGEIAGFRSRVSLGVHGLNTGNDAYVALARHRLSGAARDPDDRTGRTEP